MTVSDPPVPVPAAPAPWQMTLAEFRRAYRPIRCFQRYTAEDRSRHAASRRLGHLQRGRVGEFYYVHPLRPDVAYPSPSEARRVTHWTLIRQALAQGLPVPAEVLGDYSPLLGKEYVS